MEIYLIRHARAVPRSPEIDEAARPLTAKGKKRWARSIRGLDGLGIRFDHIYYSPWLRAAETAEMLLPLLRGEAAVNAKLTASPGRELFAELSGEVVAVVGHRPWLNELVSLLVFGTSSHAPRLELKKGGVARLSGDLTPGGMTLQAVLPPDVLRRLK